MASRRVWKEKARTRGSHFFRARTERQCGGPGIETWSVGRVRHGSLWHRGFLGLKVVLLRRCLAGVIIIVSIGSGG